MSRELGIGQRLLADYNTWVNLLWLAEFERMWFGRPLVIADRR
jgi:hypothetical protein